MAKRAESGQIDIIVPMVTVQMGVEGTVLRRVEFLAVRVQEDSAQSSLHAERETFWDQISISMSLDSLGLSCSDLIFPEWLNELLSR